MKKEIMGTLQLFTVLAHFLAFIIYTELIGFVLYKNPKALLNRLCALALVPFAIWSFGDTLFQGAPSPGSAILAINISSLGWCTFPVTIFWFYLAFTRHEKLLKNRIFITTCILLATFFIYQQWSGHFIIDCIRQPYGWSTVWRSPAQSFIFFAYYFLFSIACIYLAFDFGRKARSLREKKQAKIFYITPIIALVLGSMSDVVFPTLGISSFPPIAIIFILIWAGGLVYSITRYGLMTFTPTAVAEEILSTMADSLMLVGLDGKVITANKITCSMLGYTEDELKGMDFSSIADGIEISEIIKRGNVRSRELSYRPRGGKILPVLFSASVVRDKEGEIVGIVVTALDITDRKKMEQELRESEEKYRALVDNALVGIGIHQDGKIVYANEALASMFGYTLEEGIGLSIADMIHPDERDFVMKMAQRRQAGENVPTTYETQLLKKDGSSFYALISNALIKYNGRPATLITVADITDTKVRKELEQVNKELEAFSYSVSHDLRAPLRSIDGFSQALLEDYEDKLDEQGKDYLRRVRAATQRMSQLIDDLLNLSRISRTEIHYEEVNLTAIAKAITAELQKTQPERQVEFVIGENIVARGDSHLLRIVLDNLFRNAWKFTSKHPDARIEFGTIQQDGRLVYYVRDNGAGFDMNYANKLFTPFQRLHKSTEFEGTGIGLATVQRIIHRHGGSIWAEGEVEKGATFYFTLQS